MSEILFHYYKVHPVTWVYLSSLLMLGLFFKFSRFWSVRNLDLVLLILLAPGLLLVQYGRKAQSEALSVARSATDNSATADPASGKPGSPGDSSSPGSASSNPPAASPSGSGGAGESGSSEVATSVDAAALADTNDPGLGEVDPLVELSPAQRLEQMMRALSVDDDYQDGRSRESFGYLWLFAVGVMFVIRALVDATMTRRPLLEPNLSTGGLTFIGCSLFVFLMANVIGNKPSADDLRGPKSAAQLLNRQDTDGDSDGLRRHGPGYAVLNSIPSIATIPLLSSDQEEDKEIAYAAVARTMAILSHLAIVIGIVAVGYRHFSNIKTGIGAATLYLLLPYTAQMTGRVDHVLPAALLIWAVVCYRRPLTAGIFIGLAIGVVYYPLFLLPLWVSFYWQRGLMRFVTGVACTLAVMVLSLVFVSSDMASFVGKVQAMFGLWIPATEGLGGIWGLGWDSVYRLPILTAFIALSGSLALWPAQKNLGTLLGCSSAVMIATQFWHGYGGGIYIAWYLPLMLLTIFRPNLEDRVALSVLGQGWLPRRFKPTIKAA